MLYSIERNDTFVERHPISLDACRVIRAIENLATMYVRRKMK
jgi:hypothetical protein